MSTDAAPHVVVVGESLVDIVHRTDGAVDEAPGGSPANVALTLGRLGRAPTLVTQLADDDRGRRVRGWLERSGVTVDAVAALRTSTATALLDAGGAATYTFDLQWDLGDEVARLADDVSASADLVHVGSVGAFLEPGAGQVAALVRAVRGRAIITYDPNIRPSLVRDPQAVRARVAELIALADVVKASDEDLGWLHPGRDAIDVAREWLIGGPAVVVVTRGVEGAVAVTVAGEVVVPAVTTEVVDTVGAGDTFMGALIDGLLARETGLGVRAPGGGIRPDEVEAILRRSAAAAAITVSRPGADPPRREELLARTA